MLPPESKVVARERVVLGRVAYQVGVFASEDGFHGHWKCTACRQVGESAIGLVSDSHALSWAKDGLAIHHALAHVTDDDEDR
jgi:hypothetical protein